MTAETLSSFAGVLLSLLASYLPGFSSWFAGLDGVRKRLLMLAALCVGALGAYALACAGLGEALGLPQTCSTPGALLICRALLAALIANQAVYAITPQKPEAAANG